VPFPIPDCGETPIQPESPAAVQEQVPDAVSVNTTNPPVLEGSIGVCDTETHVFTTRLLVPELEA
jgi:hypothetical protein